MSDYLMWGGGAFLALLLITFTVMAVVMRRNRVVQPVAGAVQPGVGGAQPAASVGKQKRGGKRWLYVIAAVIVVLALLANVAGRELGANENFLFWTILTAGITAIGAIFFFMKVDQRQWVSAFVILFLVGGLVVAVVFDVGFRTYTTATVGANNFLKRAARPTPKVGCTYIGYRAVINTPGDWCMSSFAGQTTVVRGASRIAILPAAGIRTKLKYFDSSGRKLGSVILANGDGVNTRHRFPSGTQYVAFTPQVSGVVRVRFNQPCNPHLERC